MNTSLKTLMDIGLAEKEARIYLDLVSLGTSTAYKLAKYSGIKNPTVYVVLDELRKKGLVAKIPHAKKQEFFAKPLEEYLQEKKVGLQQADLLSRSLRFPDKGETRVIYYEGAEGLREGMHYRIDDMRGGIYWSILGHLENPETVVNVFVGWHKKISQQKTKMHAMVSTEDVYQFFPALNDVREAGSDVVVKIINEFDLPADFSVEVAENKEGPLFVRIISDDTLETTIIDDKKIAVVFKQMLGNLWEQGELFEG